MDIRNGIQIGIASIIIGVFVFSGLGRPEIATAPIESALVSEFAAEEQEPNEALPDLALLPPHGIDLRYENGQVVLVFSTTYYNQGSGPLELVADPATSGITDDIERVVFQRIYQKDNTYRDKAVGTFLWHQEHLHYHFSDFVNYELVSSNGVVYSKDRDTYTSNLQRKATFCVRDVTQVELKGNVYVNEEARYRVCGKELQGVSVGWGDTYFDTYADQNLNITNVPSGTYALVFHVNPRGALQEVTQANNKSSVTVAIDKAQGTVEVLSHDPAVVPLFEHIHVEQNL